MGLYTTKRKRLTRYRTVVRKLPGLGKFGDLQSRSRRAQPALVPCAQSALNALFSISMARTCALHWYGVQTTCPLQKLKRSLSRSHRAFSMLLVLLGHTISDGLIRIVIMISADFSQIRRPNDLLPVTPSFA
jgi:hypothetical protein